MGWKKEPCPDCGEPKTVVSKVCWNCLHKHPLSTTCPTCGGPMSKYSKQCRSCQLSQAANWHPCATCGTTINKTATLCRTCYDAARLAVKPRCVDCGVETKRYASEYAAERCWTCEISRRRSQPVRTCTIPECGRVHMAKGLCRTHYQAQLPRDRKGVRAGGLLIGRLKEMPCQLCGYSKMKSEAARLVPGGPYRPGNVMALCVRCHREVDAGLTPPPTPPTTEEILASRS